ncbi:MAG TPA: helix-turn-helix domain-containing protein [Steroidobacteraceae bacterium]|nr:helix-turn-helix domain-containing protein [Steroidobacteraceae bacterium]
MSDSLLILRDALFRGMTRFSEFERSLGLAPNVLAKRLEGLVASGLLEKSTDDGDHVDHYRPTERGLAFKPVIVALTAWGDRWAAPRVMSHNADANATFVTFWFGHQWEILTHIYPIAVNGVASNRNVPSLAAGKIMRRR